MKVHLAKKCTKCPKEIKRKFMEKDDEKNSSDSDCIDSNSAPLQPIPKPSPVNTSNANYQIEKPSTSNDKNPPTSSSASSSVAVKQLTTRPSSSRSIYEFADRISEKDQVRIVLLIIIVLTSFYLISTVLLHIVIFDYFLLENIFIY